MISFVRRMLRRLSRWLLRNHMGKKSVEELVSLYKADVTQVTENLNDVLIGREISDHDAIAIRWIDQGIDEETARYVSRLSSLNSALDISSVAREKGITVLQAAKLYFHLGVRLSLHWFLEQINHQAVENNWQALAKAAYREDLDWQQRQLTSQVLSCQCMNDAFDELKRLDDWIEANEQALHRWENILNEFKVGSAHEFAKFSVALRELALLNLNCSSNE